MKYILMMHGKKGGWDEYARQSKEDLQRNLDFMHGFNQELQSSGVLVDTKGLAWPQNAKIVRSDDSGQPVTDGVFPESKEFLAGYWVVDVESPEQAYKIAARLSAAPGPDGKPANMPIEVRQVLGSHSDLGL